jgi:crotonobetainyl-CoA:carnitine CoA-transferase CaiB-like acyl-CoA transferase
VSCPPELGQFNDAIYGDLLGMSAAQIEGLRQAKVI